MLSFTLFHPHIHGCSVIASLPFSFHSSHIYSGESLLEGKNVNSVPTEGEEERDTGEKKKKGRLMMRDGGGKGWWRR